MRTIYSTEINFTNVPSLGGQALVQLSVIWLAIPTLTLSTGQTGRPWIKKLAWLILPDTQPQFHGEEVRLALSPQLWTMVCLEFATQELVGSKILSFTLVLTINNISPDVTIKDVMDTEGDTLCYIYI